MSVVIDGSSGITTNSGTVVSTTDATLNGLTVGKGGGSVSTATVVGNGAMAATNTGAYNAAFGTNASNSNTSGGYNTAIGAASLYTNSTGSYNTAIGMWALQTSATTNYNTAVGYQAKYGGTGGYSTCFGALTGYSLTTGQENTLIGYAAGYALTTGSDNVFIGSAQGNGSGGLITTGSYNAILGNFSGYTAGLLDIRTTSNNIVLSDGAGNARLYYVGADSAWKSKEIYNFTSANSANMYIGSGYDIGRITSALKYKQDVRDLESIDITKFRAVRYKSKCANDDQTKDYFGFIADEVAEAGIEELVVRNAEGEVESFAYDRMTVVLLKSVQELKALVDAQATEIAELKAKVNV